MKEPCFKKRPPPAGSGLKKPFATSTDVWNPFLGFDFGRGNWLRRELEHRCFLALEQVSQQHHSPVRKFQGIMMGSRVVLIDLPKDGRRVIEDHHIDRTPGEAGRGGWFDLHELETVLVRCWIPMQASHSQRDGPRGKRATSVQGNNISKVTIYPMTYLDADAEKIPLDILLPRTLVAQQEGKPIERPERPKPTNVVNLMDALRQSVEASGASTMSKAKAHAPARRAGHEKTEQPKRKKTRRAS